MSDIRVTYLQQAAGELVAPNLSVLQSPIVAFAIGDAANFQANSTEFEPRGKLTFRGGREHIRTHFSNNDRDVQVTLIIPEDYTNIHVGNVVLYALSGGSQAAAVSVVLPEVIIKRDAFPDNTRKQDYNYPASRLEISLLMSFVEVTNLPNTTVLVNVVQPTFSNLPIFGNLHEVPTPGANPHQQFVVNRVDDTTDHPALVVKGYDDAYWTSPLFQNMLSPKYGVINGFEGQRDLWIWGGPYTAKGLFHDGIIGGLGYEDSTENSTIVGGGSYDDR